MKTLHTLNKPDNRLFEQCLLALVERDDWLFIENGVLCLMAGTVFGEKLQSAPKNINVYGLESDINARGLGRFLIPETQIIDYEGFVRLSEQNTRVISWY